MDEEFWNGLQQILDARKIHTQQCDCTTPAEKIIPYEETEHASAAGTLLDGIALVCQGILQRRIPADDAIAFFEKLREEVNDYLGRS